jgi:alpha-tubulin suppressor-like RCC1 family protein
MSDVGLYANTAYALTSGGLVYVWGNNASRQVGNNSDVSTVNIPTNITSSFGLTAPEKVVSVATGENHSVALTSAGEIFFWGTVLNNSIAEALKVNADQVYFPLDNLFFCNPYVFLHIGKS